MTTRSEYRAAYKKPFMSNGLYNALRNTQELILPALGALYFGLAKIWGLPFGEELATSFALFATFVGVLVVAARKRYNDVSVIPGQVEQAALPESAQDAAEMRLKVVDEPVLKDL